MKATKKMWIITIIAIILLATYSLLFPLPPQTMLIRFFALSGFLLLCLSLLIGPLATILPKIFCKLISARKWVGIWAFVFIFIHFLLVFIYSYYLDAALLLSSPQIALALIATILLALLTITSINKIVQKLGYTKWKTIQRLAYIAFTFSFIHFLMDTNGLFIKLPNNTTFLNLAETLMILLGVMTILLQIAGFFYKMGRKEACEEEIAISKPEEK